MRKQYVLATNNFDECHKFMFVPQLVTRKRFSENLLAYKQGKD